VDLAAVVLPRDPEDDLTLRLADPLDDLGVGVLGVLVHGRPDALQHLAHRLVELEFPGVAGEYVRVDALQTAVHRHAVPSHDQLGDRRHATPAAASCSADQRRRRFGGATLPSTYPLLTPLPVSRHPRASVRERQKSA
jgi:hypothetical protein